MMEDGASSAPEEFGSPDWRPSFAPIASQEIGEHAVPGKPSRIPADELRCLENVYELETAPDGVHYRWTGPGCTFALFLPINRVKRIQFTLVCRHGASPFNWENIFREIEGDMQLCHYHSDGRLNYLDGIIPARPGMQGALIKFHLQETRQPPADSLGRRDPRKLGIWIEAIEFA